MKVTLAGATIDRRFWKDDKAATPETISAAYARISHSPKRIPELREIAVNEVEKARKSNENIIYKMGQRQGRTSFIAYLSLLIAAAAAVGQLLGPVWEWPILRGLL